MKKHIIPGTGIILAADTARGQFFRYSSDTWTLLNNQAVVHGFVVFNDQNRPLSTKDVLVEASEPLLEKRALTPLSC